MERKRTEIKHVQKEGDTRPFPVQREGREGEACTIPWWLAEAVYEEYSAQYGTDQSLEQMAERNGFGRVEILVFLRGERF